jgi:hypothetical protein
MNKLVFLLGVAIGFLLGSKAGPDACNQVVKKVRSIFGSPNRLTTRRPQSALCTPSQ